MSFSSGAITKAGTIQGWGNATPPDGWLLCDGSAVSRSLYSELFAAIGTAYGAGDGSTTFNLPNLTNRFLEGNGTGFVNAGLPNITGNTQGSTKGNNSWYGNGCFVQGAEQDQRGTAGNGIKSYILNFNANKSNAIYGASSTVQPLTCKCYFIVKY